MKNILITGTNSYIGNSLSSWLEKYPDDYSIETISLRDNGWKTKNFSDYDVVFHVAGIAHVSSNPNMEEEYYKVNRDLTVEAAEKAKQYGVKQFIFMSSIIVYGDSNRKKVIDKYTEPNPSNFYGDSKLQAEKGILPLENRDFRIVIIRPPMIYGKGSKGNYPKLSKAARRLPLFPNIDNQRSMIHIDNLCEFIRLAIDNEEKGIFYPQNKEYVKTSEMVQMISEVHGKNMKITRLFNPFILPLIDKIGILNKVFGDFVYEQSMSQYKEDYRQLNLSDSIKKTEQ